jgi:hypothetical protein
MSQGIGFSRLAERSHYNVGARRAMLVEAKPMPAATANAKVISRSRARNLKEAPDRSDGG